MSVDDRQPGGRWGANEGVQIGGDNRGAAAAGPHARAHYQASPAAGPDLAEVVESLQRLRTLVERHPAEVSEPEFVLRDIERIDAEVRVERPDRGALRDIAGRILRRTAEGGTVFMAAYQLGQLLA